MTDKLLMIHFVNHLLHRVYRSHKMLTIFLCGVLMTSAILPRQGWTQGDDVQRAVELDRRAKQFIAQGKYHEASELYRKALEIFEHPDLFINLARSEIELKEYQSAYSACVKALRSPLLTPQKRVIATQCVTDMQARMNEIRALVDTYPSGAKLPFKTAKDPSL